MAVCAYQADLLYREALADDGSDLAFVEQREEAVERARVDPTIFLDRGTPEDADDRRLLQQGQVQRHAGDAAAGEPHHQEPNTSAYQGTGPPAPGRHPPNLPFQAMHFIACVVAEPPTVSTIRSNDQAQRADAL